MSTVLIVVELLPQAETLRLPFAGLAVYLVYDECSVCLHFDFVEFLDCAFFGFSRSFLLPLGAPIRTSVGVSVVLVLVL